jgi:16S rRNA (cytidine1402-2'-O)-methyltransferase
MLYLVPTPIGNLEDITLRAITTLKSADILLVEDSRTASVLLRHFNIDKKVYAHHQHNEHAAVNEIVKWLKEGKTVALISDAGTPGISDPGFLLTRACIENDIEVVCLPGATAFVPALVASGIPCTSFVFEGFLPVKKGRKTKLESLAKEERTMIFYESPHKILKTLEDFITTFGAERKACVARELSKIYEEKKRGSLKELLEYYIAHPAKGEIVVIVSGAEE